MAKIEVSSLKKGDFVRVEEEIYMVSDTEFNYRGRGSALVKIKLKNIQDGKYKTFTFKSGEILEAIDVEVKKIKFLYKEKDELIFMDPFTYEQYSLSSKAVENLVPFLKEGEEYYAYFYGGSILNIKMPKTVKLKVINAEEAVKGDRVSGAKKPVIVETGVKVMVPLFIKKGDIIVINPETGEYVERA